METSSDLDTADPKSAIASFVNAQIAASQAEIDRVALAQQEAFLNSLAAHADDFPVDPTSPYGDPFGMVRQFFEDRAISDIISPFSAEQTSALTTALASSWVGQRELMYVEPNGGEEAANYARIRERGFDRVIHGPYTDWAIQVWMAWRDVVVKSRGYLEVQSLKIEEKRRVYTYNPVAVATNAILSGFMRLFGAAGTTRLSSLKTVTLWDGPVIRCLPFGTVYRDPSETVLSNLSRWVAVKYHWTRAEIVAEGERQFGKGSVIRFRESNLEGCKPIAEVESENSRHVISAAEVVPVKTNASDYDTFEVIVWKGIDPAREPDCRYIYWIIGNKCIAAKEHDGSGPWNNIVELCWDPMVDYATSVSPIMLIRRIQEMASLLLSDAADASTWDSHPAGLVNELIVGDIGVVQGLRPAQFEKKLGEGQAIEPIKLGGNSIQTLQNAATLIEMGRAGTAGTAQITGTTPPGVTTATEFNGLSQGAMGRIQLQQEINAGAIVRLYQIALGQLRDALQTDAALQNFIGDDGTLGPVALVALGDGSDDMECVPMQSRYNIIRQRELAMVSQLKNEMQTDPYLAAKINKEPLYDDYIYLMAGGPRGWRWAKTSAQMREQGLTPEAIEQTMVQGAMANAGTGKGQASPPAEPSAQPSQVLTPPEAGGGAPA